MVLARSLARGDLRQYGEYFQGQYFRLVLAMAKVRVVSVLARIDFSAYGSRY